MAAIVSSSFASVCRCALVGSLVALWLIPHPASAQAPMRWRWANPDPHGNNIFDLAYSPIQNLAVQVTEQGQIYTSSDLAFWTPRVSGTTLALRGVTFFNKIVPPRILVTGQNGTVLYGDSEDKFLPGTLATGPTTDWLEAVAASPNLAVAVGDNGAIYTSMTGLSWSRQTPSPAITEWLRGVAFGNSYFVIAGDSGFIGRSQNGTNWSRMHSGGTNLNRVHFANNRFTIVGEAGFSLSSTNNGQSWFTNQCGATNDLFQASSSANARLLVGDQEVRLEQGTVWSNELAKSNGPPVWTYFANLGRPGFFLIGGQTGLMAEGYETNAALYYWAQSDNSFRHWLFDMTYASNLFVTVGDRATVMTSGNGINWKLELVPQSVATAVFLGVGGSTNLLVAAGNAGSLIISPNILTNVSILVTNSAGNVSISNFLSSSLGVFWLDVRPRPTTNDLQGVCFGNDLYVVTGDNGSILTSPNGTNWTQRTSPASKLLSSVTAWPGGFVATGDDGAIVTSNDGLSWAIGSSDTTNWIYKVRYLNGLLIGVGQNGIILTSMDGIQWTEQTSGTSAWLNDATFIDNTFFVVGTQGTILTSTNASDWTSPGTITRKALYSAATDGAQLVVGGVEGIILRSRLVPDLTPIRILDFARLTSTNSPNLIQNFYLFGGKPDQQFTLDRRAALDTNLWITGLQLEFFDGSGTLFYLENLPEADAPSQEYYQATLIPQPGRRYEDHTIWTKATPKESLHQAGASRHATPDRVVKERQ